MKPKLLLVTFLTICSSIILAMPTDTRKQIKMKVRQKIEHRSTSSPNPVEVYINNSLLVIKFNNPINDGIISIVNTLTGETIYNEKIDTLENQKSIYLFEQKKYIEYNIEISSSQWLAVGVFTLK